MSLFIFAHQDDEIGVFSELHRLVSSGDTIIVVYLTSGTPSGEVSDIRNCESVSVLTKLGIPQENIYFLGSELGIPDGKLSNYIVLALQSIMKWLIKNKLPQRIYFPAWEGGHQDHDAVHLVGIALGKRLEILEQCFQFPLYTGYHLPSILFRLFLPIPENETVFLSKIPWNRRIKFITYCLSYPSQWKTWIGLFPFFLIHYIFKGTQVLQPVSLKRISQRPHSGMLLYERRGFYSYKKFSKDSSIIISEYISNNS